MTALSKGLGFRVLGFGFRVSGFGFRDLRNFRDWVEASSGA